MPTYEYACTVADCGHEFERVQSFSDNTLTECPECSGRLRKVWGSIGVVFKGSGFYRNDSRAGGKDNGKDGGKDGGKDKADSAAKSDSTGAKSESGKSDPNKAKENAGSASGAKKDTGTPASTSTAGSSGSSGRSSAGKATPRPAA